MKLSELAGKREGKRLIRDEFRQQRWNQGFFDMDSRILAEIPDDNLVNLQAGVRPETAPYIRAQHEWQRRLIARQIRAVRWASVIGAVIGAVGVIAGVILGWFLNQVSQGRAAKTADGQTRMEMTQPQNAPEPKR
jgi:hypothetical protein